MTLEEIKSKICDIRCELEELADDARQLFCETDNKRIENVANYLEDELTIIAGNLSDLEDVEFDEDYLDECANEHLDEWWNELSNEETAEISGIPFPAYDDGGRGDNEYEFKDRTDKWWNARTTEQKQEIYDHYSSWWDID